MHRCVPSVRHRIRLKYLKWMSNKIWVIFGLPRPPCRADQLRPRKRSLCEVRTSAQDRTFFFDSDVLYGGANSERGRALATLLENLVHMPGMSLDIELARANNLAIWAYASQKARLSQIFGKELSGHAIS
jgi:hypothetical protein